MKKSTLQTKEFINTDLSFYDVQDIISATPRILKRKYKLELADTGFYLTSNNLNYFITNNYRLQNIKRSDNFKTLEFSFNDYQKSDNFPRQLFLKFVSEETFEIMINYSKIEFNKIHNIVFKIPDSYNEIK